MTGLADIAPLSDRVNVRGQSIEVRGISAANIARLIVRFPEIKRMFSGHGLDASLDVDGVASMAETVIGAIIAAGTGEMGNEAAERAASNNLAPGEQAELLAAIFRLTFPQGVGPFVDAMNAVADAAGATGWGQGTKSRGLSNSSSQTDTRQEMSGDIPQDS